MSLVALILDTKRTDGSVHDVGETGAEFRLDSDKEGQDEYLIRPGQTHATQGLLPQACDNHTGKFIG